MSILSFVGEIFEPAANLIDDMHTSDEEKAKARRKMAEIQNKATARAMEFEQQRIESQSEIIQAEATGKGWLKNNWRPITMITFLILVVAYWFGFTPENLSEERLGDVFELIKLGLVGYIGGRSAEKIVPGIASAIKERKRGDG